MQNGAGKFVLELWKEISFETGISHLDNHICFLNSFYYERKNNSTN